MAESRPMRVCDVCGEVDTDPRHVFAGAPDEFPVNKELQRSILDLDLPSADRARIYDEVADTTVQQRHMDCCREAGCPDGSCNVVTKGAEDLRGAKLIKHLTSGK